VKFRGELDGVMESIGSMMRNQYVLSYVPSDVREEEGERQEIEVFVDVDGDGDEDDDLDLQYRKYRLGQIS
jgi:hypothetical protein